MTKQMMFIMWHKTHISHTNNTHVCFTSNMIALFIIIKRSLNILCYSLAYFCICQIVQNVQN